MNEPLLVPERFRDLVSSRYTKYTNLTGEQLRQMLAKQGKHRFGFGDESSPILIAEDVGVKVYYVVDVADEMVLGETNVRVDIDLKGCGSWKLQLKYKVKT